MRLYLKYTIIKYRSLEHSKNSKLKIDIMAFPFLVYLNQDVFKISKLLIPPNLQMNLCLKLENVKYATHKKILKNNKFKIWNHMFGMMHYLQISLKYGPNICSYF